MDNGQLGLALKLIVDTKNLQGDVLKQIDALKLDPILIEAKVKADSVEKDLKKLAKQIQGSIPKLDMGKDFLNLDKINLDGRLKAMLDDSSKAAQQFSGRVAELRKALEEADTVEFKKIKKEFQNINDEVGRLKKSYNELEKNSIASQFLELDKINMDNRMTSWLNNNTRAAEQFGSRIEELKARLLDADKVEFTGINKEFRNIQSEAKAMGLTGQSAFEQIAGSADKLFKLLIGGSAIMLTVRSIRQMINEVKELDYSLVELNKVALLSSESLEQFTKRAFEAADGIGRTGREVVDATAEFIRAGYAIEESFNMAQAALVMTNVGDGINDVAQAASALIAVLRGYSMDESDIMSIVDRINTVSNKAPVTFANLTDGLERVSGTMAQTGTSLDQTIGLLTASFGQLRNMEKSSSGLLMISQRLRGVGEDGEAIEGLAAKLQESFSSIAGIDIEVNGQLRSTYDILSDLAEVWDSLSSKQQQYLGELAAGNRQITVLQSIIANWEDVESAVENAANSMGSAERENAIFLDSIQGKMNQFQSMFQKLSQNVINSDLVKGTFDTGTGLMGLLNGLVEVVGTLPVVMGAASSAMSAKNMGLFKVIADQADGASTSLAFLGKSFAQIRKDFTAASGAGKLKSVFTPLNDGITEAIQKLKSVDVAPIMDDFNRAFHQGQVEARGFVDSLDNQHLKNYFMTVQDGNATLAGYTEYTRKVVTEHTAMTASAKLATAAQRALAIAANAFIAIGISWAISSIVTWLSNLKTEAERTAEAIEKQAEKIKELGSEIADLDKKISDLSAVEDRTAAQEQYLKMLEEELLAKQELEKIEKRKLYDQKFGQREEQNVAHGGFLTNLLGYTDWDAPSKITIDPIAQLEKYVERYNVVLKQLEEATTVSEIENLTYAVELQKDGLISAYKELYEFKEALGSLPPEAERVMELIASTVLVVESFDEAADEATRITETLTSSFGILAAELSNLSVPSDLGDQLLERLQSLKSQFDSGSLSIHDYFNAINTEINTLIQSSKELGNEISAAFFVDAAKEAAQGLTEMLNKFHEGKISLSEYLDGFTAIGNMVSSLTTMLQENADQWVENGVIAASSLDTINATLHKSMDTIDSYKDSIYSLSQILTKAVKEGSDEFTAHTQVIAADLMHIVETSGIMADQVRANLGSTTEEIAASLTESVANQQLAAQAIAANTNTAIVEMAEAVGTLFQELGNAISNFKVELNFKVTSFQWDKNTGFLPELTYEVSGNSAGLDMVGAAINNVGSVLKERILDATVTLQDFYKVASDAYNPSSATIDNYTNALDNLKKSAKDAAAEIASLFKNASSSINNLLNMTVSMLKQEYSDKISDLKSQLSDLTSSYQSSKAAATSAYNAEKKALDSAKKSLQNQNKERQKSHNNAVKYENELYKAQQKRYNQEKKGLQDLIDGERKRINLLLEALRLKEEERSYQKELAAKQKSVADLEAQLLQIQFDTSESGNKKRRELEEELAKRREELEEYQHDRSISLQEDALKKALTEFEDHQNAKIAALERQWEKETEAHEQRLAQLQAEWDAWSDYYDQESARLDARAEQLAYAHAANLARIDAEYQASKAKLEKEIADLQEAADDEVAIREEAIRLIEQRSEDFYDRLIEWNKRHGTSVQADVEEAWRAAYQVLDMFNDKEIDVQRTLELIVSEMYRLEAATDSATEAMNKLAAAAAAVKAASSSTAKGGGGTTAGGGGGRSSARVDHSGGHVENASPVQRTISSVAALGSNEEIAIVEKGEKILPSNNNVRAATLMADYIADKGMSLNQVLRSLTGSTSISGASVKLPNIGKHSMGDVESSTHNEIDASVQLTIQGNVDDSTLPKIRKELEDYEQRVISQVFSRLIEGKRKYGGFNNTKLQTV